MMVAAHNSDLKAARNQGLKTAFVLREKEHGPLQTTDLKPDSEWDYVCTDFIDLAQKLQNSE
jgi:2-haloacid dehalogenase